MLLSKNAMKASVLLAGLFLAGCMTTTETDVAEPAPTATSDANAVSTRSAMNPLVTDKFGGGGLTWSRTGGLLYRYAAIERDGEIYICGAFTGRGATNTRKASREAMRQATVTLNGQSISRNLRYFTEVSNANWETQLVGVETSCRSTGQPADGVQLNAIRVELREGRYRIRL